MCIISPGQLQTRITSISMRLYLFLKSSWSQGRKGKHYYYHTRSVRMQEDLLSVSFLWRKASKSLCLRWPYKEEPCPRNGGAIWVDDVIQSGFTACVEDSSNGTKEVNWIAVRTAPSGSQISTKLLSSWTTGTEFERMDFQQVELC